MASDGLSDAAAYVPRPIDTDGIDLPADLVALTEMLAENSHEHWAQARLAEGWRYGPGRDEASKTHPCLVPYAMLPDSEREYDRRTAMQTIRVVLSLGYRIARDQ